MLKIYLKFIVVIVFASNLFAQNIPSYVPKDGLVGWWPFNGNANDESGNGNHGKVNGASLMSDRNGKINSAYQFGNNIEILNSNKIEIGLNTFSFSFWVNRDRITDYWLGEILISKGKNNIVIANCGRNGGLDTNNNFNGFGFDSYGKYYGAYNGILPINKWCHVVCIKSTDKMIYYIDNNKYTTNLNEDDHRSISDLNEFLIFGKSFNGSLDDIACYNRELSEIEVNSLFSSTPLPCVPPTAKITTIGSATFCEGGFVNLQAYEVVNNSYEWYSNNKLISGANKSVYQASTSGIYNVKVTSGGCVATSNSVSVSVNQYPSSDVSVSGPTTFCEGGSVTLTALGNGTFKWNNGVTSKSIIINKSGIYRVEVTSNNCTSSSKDYSIAVNPNPIAKITPDGPTAFCEGGAVNLVASGGTTYKWNSGILTPSITVTKTGTYYVNVINSYGCSVNKSYDVNVYPNPTVSITPIAQFTLQNNSSIKLSATPTGGTFKGEGVTGTSFNPSNIGLGKKTIYYNYTSTQGCSGSAKLQTIVVDSIGTKCTSYDTITVINTINDTVGILKIKFQLTTGIKANQFTSVSVYPNPTSDVLIIDASDVQALNGYRYKISDVLGKNVYNELVSATKTEISLKTFGKAGVYILHVVDANNTSIETRQIVLE